MLKRNCAHWLVLSLVAGIGLVAVPQTAVSQLAQDDSGAAVAKLHPLLLDRFAQESEPVKAWVFFADKGVQSPAQLDAALAQVAASYDRRAIQRRQMRGTRAAQGLPIFDEHDLPVVADYVDAVVATGARLHVTSRWLNAVSAYITPAQAEQIAALPFVNRLEPVAQARRITPVPDAGAVEEPAASGRGADSINYGQSGPQLQQINLPPVHDEGYTGQGVIIGILDTGFKRTHVAFNQPGHVVNVIAEYDFVMNDGNTAPEPGDPSSQHEHGTMILGCIGSYMPGTLVGGAFSASFVLAKTEDTTQEVPAEEDNYAAGLEFIEAHGGDMTTSSLGYIDWYTQAQLNGLTAVTTIAVNLSTSHGVHHTNAAGNEYHDANPAVSHLIAPADAFQCMTIGAVDSTGAIASFSSDGPTADGRVKPELLARGISTYTVDPFDDNSYTTASGTSLSTPLAACAVACLIQARPYWTVDEMRTHLFATADYFVAHGTFDPLYILGYGIINAYAAKGQCSHAGTIGLDSPMYACADTAEITVADCDLDTNHNAIEQVTITIASTSEPAGESVTLTETAPDSAEFRGSIGLSTTNAPGVLQIATGDAITATYIDANNGQGGFNVPVIDTATVDCVAPVISNVHATNIQPHTATIAFTANELARGTVHYGLSCGNLNLTQTGDSFGTDATVNLTGLQDNTTYYYSVDAVDVAGNLTSDPNCYTFATPEVPDYFTELFASAWDLQNLTLHFAPNGSVDFYVACDETPISNLPTDPAGGTPLALTDDSYTTVTLTGGAHVLLYGTSYATFYVGSNGYITFTSGDTNLTPSLATHFTQPRISALMRDLNPSTGGQVSWKQLADRAVVTWLNVPCYSGCGANTFQIEMFFDGRLTISYLTVAATDGLAGLSHSTSVPSDFFMSDLSAEGSCGPRPPNASSANVVVPVNVASDVTLIAGDDGLPNPPGALTYRIVTLPTHGDLSDPGAGPITTVPYDLVNFGSHVTYLPDPGYYGADAFQFLADDGGVPPDGGPSNIATETLNVQFGPPVITTTALPNACLSHNYNFQMQASQGQPPLAWSIVATGSYVEADLGNNQFTATGTAQNWRNDDQSWPYTLPFTFPYYGVNRTTVNVCSNGFLDFTSGDTTYSNSDAGLIAAARIAPLWDDLLTNFNASDDIYIDATIPNQVTIRWLGVTYNGHIAVNFAVTLYADGRIQFHYGPGNTGLTPTIGISKGDGVDYVLSTYNNATALTNANSHEFSQTSPLPPNITLSAAGLLSGVPTVTGTFTPHIKVTDALNRSAEQTFTLVVDATCGLLGDVNCDGIVDFDDINPFVLALSDPIGYHNAYPNCDINNADCDGSGIVDFDDINPFVAILSGGGK